MKLRKSNLRDMINQGLVNDQIKRKVLEGLKRIVIRNDAYSNGDLKERVNKFACNNQHPVKHKLKTHSKSRITF